MNGMAGPVDPIDKKLIVVLIFGGILMIGLIALVVTTYSGVAGPGRSTPFSEVRTVNPVTTQPGDFLSPGSTGNAVLPPDTMQARMVAPIQNPTPSPVISAQPDFTGYPVTSVPGDSSGPAVPRPFTLSVSPASASGKRGETISYTLRIEGGEGQTEPIHFTLKAGALFFQETYDLGDELPPFPKTSVYQFLVPSNIPPGITINGVLTATGAGQTREQPVTLNVL